MRSVKHGTTHPATRSAPHVKAGTPMPLHEIPAVPENVVQLVPPRLETLDPVQYARNVVALHSCIQVPGNPVSTGCDFSWPSRVEGLRFYCTNGRHCGQHEAHNTLGGVEASLSLRLVRGAAA